MSDAKYIEIDVAVRQRDPAKGSVLTLHGPKAKVSGKPGTAYATHTMTLSPAERRKLASQIAGDGLEALVEKDVQLTRARHALSTRRGEIAQALIDTMGYDWDGADATVGDVLKALRHLLNQAE